jgi:hypothetical protein
MKQLLIVVLMAWMVQSVHATPFQSGYYYDNAGLKTEGLLRYDQGTFGLLFNRPGYLEFRENADSKKIRLSVNDISSFVIGKDSFAIVCNIKVNSISGHFEKDFAQVEISGAMNMFLHRCFLFNGRHYFPHQSYILSKDNINFFAVWKPKM